MTAYTTCLALSAYIIFEHYCLPQHHSTSNTVLQTLLSVLSTRHKPQVQRQHLLLLTEIRVSSYFDKTMPIKTLQSMIKISESYFLPVLHTKCTPGPAAQQEASWSCTVAAIWKWCELKAFNQIWFTVVLACPLQRFHKHSHWGKGGVTFLFSGERHIVFPVLVLQCLLLQVRQEPFPVEGTRGLFGSLVLLPEACRQQRVLQNKWSKQQLRKSGWAPASFHFPLPSPSLQGSALIHHLLQAVFDPLPTSFLWGREGHKVI